MTTIYVEHPPFSVSFTQSPVSVTLKLDNGQVTNISYEYDYYNDDGLPPPEDEKARRARLNRERSQHHLKRPALLQGDQKPCSPTHRSSPARRRVPPDVCTCVKRRPGVKAKRC